MRLISLSMEGFRQFREPLTLDLPDGLIGICGLNGVGKSKIVEAVGYALFGPAGILPSGDRDTDVPSAAVPSAGLPRGRLKVALEIEVRSVKYRIEREQRRAALRELGAADALAETPRGVNAKIMEILRLNPGIFHGTFVARQDDIVGLQGLRRPERERLVNRLIGVAQVERAVALAADEAERRGHRAAEARGAVLRTSADIAVELDAKRTILEEAQAAQASAAGNRTDAQHIHEAKRTALSALEVRRSAREGVISRLRDLDGYSDHQAEALERAKARLTKSQMAQTRLSEIAEELGASTDVAEQLQINDDLADVAGVRRDITVLEADLADVLRPREEERVRLLGRIEGTRSDCSSIDDERTIVLARHNRTDERLRQAKADAGQYGKYRDNAAELGPEGACAVCGHAFGDGLADALEHYARGADQAQVRASELEDELGRIAEEIRDLDARVSASRDLCQRLTTEISEYDEVPGLISAKEGHLREVEAALRETQPVLLSMVYDPAEHQRMRETADRHRALDREKSTLESVAAELADSETEVASLEESLRDLTEKIEVAQAELDGFVGLDEAAATADREVDDARAALDTADSIFAGCQTATTIASTELEACKTTLEDARLRELELARAERDVRIAEAARTSLRQVLTSITDEARPRIAELMDEWARSIMGPEWRVTLDSDYSVIADNGSGEHRITHFSGGEQTLLALMLRAAISIFCQERAGFDAGFLVLDEVFGGQDEVRRGQLVGFLQEIQQRYTQVFIVNHIDDVTDMLDQVIDVTAVGPKSSTAAIRN